MAKFKGIYLNDIKMPDFVRVLGIEHSILPPVSQELLTIGGKAGAYDYGNELGVREITVNIQIITQEENTLPQYLEQLSAWLYYKDAKKLVLGDDPDTYYMAKFSGDSNIQESFLVGEGSITFICTEPHKFGLERTVLIPDSYDGTPLMISNGGNAETFPKMKFNITKDVSTFSVVSGDEFIDLGSPYDVEENTIVNPNKRVFYDQLTSKNGWSNAQNVEAGTRYGTFEVYASHAFRQEGLDFGEGISGWHGASMVKSLTAPTQDFEMKFNLKMSTSVEKVGRVQLQLHDSNGKMLFRTQLKDATRGYTRFEFESWAYDSSGKRKKISHKPFGSSLTSFDGYIKLSRIGKKLKAEIYNGTELLHRVEIGDNKGAYQSRIAKVNLHIGVHGDESPAYMEARDIVIYNKDTEVDAENGEIPLILQAGDVLEIDNNTGAILKNGVPFFEYLNPASTYISLEKGSNGVIVAPNDCFTDGEITYTERSL